ncbi:hypothetical protein [Legionella cincinnatiensis]|uniref:RavJ peptidase domain-containing protein n=1 Tax=Legionella cincinnatiensis TaxID=28085 RepID=A0A378IGZ6_9GAMM|nr:hypothetical protein [Legionella cincinnatiensis]KTC84802.1 hypothetical protein Lcin_1835 [Legionella cincinnatiensis]STX34313.1 Uncharacterised protein [Legionella cincinnatiensis]
MPTPKQIRDRLIQEQYQKFVVADIGTFRWCLNRKSPEGVASEKRYDAYSKNPLSRTPPFNQWSSPQLIAPDTAQGLINFAKNRNKKMGFTLNEDNEKLPVRVSECSNFAYHSAGVLLDDPEIRKDYDVAVIGSMYNKKTDQYQHNITLLVPKGTVLPQPPEQLTKENFPSGTLIVDPWAVGMGHSPEHALAVTMDKFAFVRSLFPATVNYQSSLDKTLAETPTGNLSPYTGSVPSSVEHPRPSVESRPPNIPRSSSQPSQLQFKGLEPLPENFTPLLKRFDEQLKEVKKQAISLETRGHSSAALEAQKFYNNLVDERNKFIKQEPNDTNKKAFVDNCSNHIREAQNSELKHARGWKSIFFNIAKAVAFVFTAGFYTKQTTSIQKVNSMKEALNDIKPKSVEGEQLQESNSPPRSPLQHSN